MKQKRPNFLIVMTDQQRGDTVLPGSSVQMPRLKMLGKEGIRFENAFCPSPHCCPSRTSFFSGLYPSGHGIWNNVLNDQAISREIKPGVRLWSEDLAEAGYENWYFGKWHLSAVESPKDRGWSEGSISAGPGERHGYLWEDYARLAAAGKEPETRPRGVIRNRGYAPMPLFRSIKDDSRCHDRRVVNETILKLNELKGNPAPWCIYSGFFSPHDPFEAPEEYLARYPAESIELPPSLEDAMEDKPVYYRMLRERIFAQMTREEMRECIRHYYALCSRIDEQTAAILERLDHNGQADDTVVIFCSDHGDYGGEHGLFCKGIPGFDSAYRVPLIIRRPAGIKEPERSPEDLISLADLAPTILEAAGIPYDPGRFHGRSIFSKEPWRESIYMQSNGVELYFTQRILRTKEHKLVFNGFDREELYDLAEDPGECRNLASMPAMADLKEELYRKLWKEAHYVGDGVINGYFTVRMAGTGPAAAF